MPTSLPSIDVRKTLTDTGYIVVGLGVMGVQQAQARSRDLRSRIDGRTGGALEQGRSALAQTSACARSLTTDVRTRLGDRTRTARGLAEAGVRDTVGRAQDLRSELGKRTEPVTARVQEGLGTIPERVVSAVEPVTARVQEGLGTIPERVASAVEPVTARVRSLGGSAA